MKLSLLSITTLLLGSVISKDLPFCNQDDIRLRKNIMSLSDGELTRYFNAVKKLNSGPKPTKWDEFAKMHIENYPEVHMKPAFLIWHRFFLYFIEKELQKIDPQVTIPYWDWTVHSEDPNNDPIYSDKYFGKARVNGCVTSGQFKDFQVYYWHDGSGSNHCLRRKAIFDETVTSGKLMDTLYLNDYPIERFANNLEGAPHGRIHNGIGGEFSGHASPGDPLFYSHHAFIDKLYFDWQERHFENLDEYHMPRYTPIAPWNYPIIQAVDTLDRMCYAYKEEHFPWTVRPNLRIASSPQVAALPYTVPKNITTAEELDQHDANFVTKKVDKDANDVKLLDLEFISKQKFNLTNIRMNEQRELNALQVLDQIKVPEPKAGIVV